LRRKASASDLTHSIPVSVFANDRATWDDLAPFYDEIYGTTEDFDYWAKIVSEYGGQPEDYPRVLELGCGTARVALALAEKGYHVDALDHSAEMLKVARRRIAGSTEIKGSVRLMSGDMRKLDLDGKYDVIICPSNTLAGFVDRRERECILAGVRGLLSDGGVFAADSLFKDARKFKPKGWDFWDYEAKQVFYPHLGNRSFWCEYTIVNREFMLSQVSLTYTSLKGNQARTTSITGYLKLFTRDGLRDELLRAGLSVVCWYGGYDLKPHNFRSHHLGFVARKRLQTQPSLSSRR